MPQIFPPRSNLFSRLSILAGLAIVGALAGAVVWYTHSSAVTKVGVPIEQPVPFSHNLHVGALALNCRYCHDAVDQSAFASIPPTETCMSCHSQIATDRETLALVRESYDTGRPIAWNRVNNVPDHVYFNHQIHVNKGVGCESCHGRVDEMAQVEKAHTFYMSWCLECHRNPGEYLRPVEEVYTMGYTPDEEQETLGARLVQEYGIRTAYELTNCSICHR